MKYSVDEYKQRLEKAHRITCDGNAIDKMMKPYRAQLYQGIEVGDGVTLNLYSDSHAATVVRRTDKSLFVKRDTAIRTDGLGMSDVQEYRYERDNDAPEERCIWSEKRGCFMWCGKTVSVGRHEYYDYTF